MVLVPCPTIPDGEGVAGGEGLVFVVQFYLQRGSVSVYMPVNGIFVPFLRVTLSVVELLSFRLSVALTTRDQYGGPLILF